MILTIKNVDHESKLKIDLVKNNLLEICKWFNFIEDNNLAEFPDNHITMYVTLDYHIDSPHCYMNNGVYFSSYGMAIGRKLPTRPTWDCYCVFSPNKIPMQFVFINKTSNIFNSFNFGAQFSALETDLVEIDTREYDGC